MIPVGAYLSWEGKLYEGTGVEPDSRVDWSPDPSGSGIDIQLQQALEVVSRQ